MCPTVTQDKFFLKFNVGRQAGLKTNTAEKHKLELIASFLPGLQLKNQAEIQLLVQSPVSSSPESSPVQNRTEPQLEVEVD